jgi:hypothetical protein
MYQVSFPAVKRLWLGVNHPPTSSAEVKERVELYLYSPTGFHSLFLCGLYSSFCYFFGSLKKTIFCHYSFTFPRILLDYVQTGDVGDRMK